jgi:hypothetical protein
MQRMMASEKVEASGAFAGTRGGSSSSTLMRQRIYEVLGKVGIDNFHTGVYPIMPFAKLGEVLAMWD